MQISRDKYPLAELTQSRGRHTEPRVHLRWWVEVLLVLGFYAAYSTIRNFFGSESVSATKALANAEQIIEPGLIFPAQVLEIPSN